MKISTALPTQAYSLQHSPDFGTTCKMTTLRLASYLNEPLCKVREYFYTFYILDALCETATQKAMKIVFLSLGIAGYAILTPLTAPLGAALRGLTAAVQSQPHVYLARGEGKELPANSKITLVSHNQCYMPAGYSITDGHVTPASDRARMEANLKRLKSLDPDVICLYEVLDICDADYLSSQLPNYPFIIPVAGVRAIGPSSMMYVASKYEIVENSVEFVPFAKGTELTGRAQWSEKGFLSFDLRSRGQRRSFATVISTHLQHSEVPAKPEREERRSRGRQMRRIGDYVQRKGGRNVIVTGDLNQGDAELDAAVHQRAKAWLRRDQSVRGKKTWGGDGWSARLMGKIPSSPQVLDYTCVGRAVRGIATKVIGVGYRGEEFRKEAGSDHKLLFSRIKLSI